MVSGRFNNVRPNQEGIALFMSLVMLLLLTLLGLSSVQTTSLQERMSRNARDNNMAFQAAEATIREGEAHIEDNINSLAPFDSAGAASDGLYYGNDYDEVPNWHAVDWSGNNVRTAGTSIDGVSRQPVYIIEHIKTVISEQDRLNLGNIGQSTGSARTQMFRISSYGVGGTDTARVMIQTTYGKRF